MRNRRGGKPETRLPHFEARLLSHTEDGMDRENSGYIIGKDEDMAETENGRLLGIDLGTVRTGFAVSDPGGFLASPMGTVTERDLVHLADQTVKTAAEQGTKRVVLGHPRNMDGTRGDSARRAEEFAALLTERGLEVILWDERMTTVSAIGYLNQTNTRGQKRKAVVDTVAAEIILQDYLDSRKGMRKA